MYFSMIILVSLLGVGFFMISKGGDILATEIERSLASLAVESTKVVQGRIEAQRKVLEMIALRNDIQDMDWDEQQPILNEQIEKTDFVSMGIIAPDNNIRFSNRIVTEADDAGYIGGAWDGQITVSDIWYSELSQRLALTYAAPIKDGEEVVGVLVADWPIYSLSEITNDIGFGESGYGYMINGEGTVVAYPELDRVFERWNPIIESEEDATQKSIAGLFRGILDQGSGVGKYTFEGKEMYAGYEPVHGTDWIMVITVAEEEMFAAIPELQNSIILIIAIILIIGIIITLLLGNSISRPIISIAGQSEQLAELDIRQDVQDKLLDRKDEIGVLANGLQNITVNLRDIINRVNISSLQVVSTSEELMASTQQSAAASE